MSAEAFQCAHTCLTMLCGMKRFGRAESVSVWLICLFGLRIGMSLGVAGPLLPIRAGQSQVSRILLVGNIR